MCFLDNIIDNKNKSSAGENMISSYNSKQHSIVQ